MTPSPDQQSHRIRKDTGLRRLATVATALAIGAGLTLLGVGVWQLFFTGTGEEYTGAERRSVEHIAHEIDAAPASRPTSVTIPAIDYVAPVAPMEVGEETILDPPTADEIFWLEDFSLPGTGSENTVYLIGHTSTSGFAVFDPLVNRAEQKTTVLPGDEIIVATEQGSVPYEVVATERHDQTALSDLEDVWTNEPGRLVLITCFFAAESDIASDNMVLFARQADAVSGNEADAGAG